MDFEDMPPGWQPVPYRPLLLSEVEASRESIVMPMRSFADVCLKRYQQEIDPRFTRWHYEGLVSLIEQATIIFWKADLWTAAASGGDKFVGKTLDTMKLNPTIQLWIPDRDYNLPPDITKQLKLGLTNVLTAILVLGNLDRLDPTQNKMPKGTLATVNIYIPPQSLYRVLHHDGEIAFVSDYQFKDLVPTYRIDRFLGNEPICDAQGTSLMALIDFMNQEYVSVEKHLPSRQVRRNMERHGQKWADIRHVVLRRAAPQKTEHEKKNFEWSCQWLVSGHWRNQWYPGAKTHHPKFIPEYIKGDPEKPLKPRTKTIYSVER